MPYNGKTNWQYDETVTESDLNRIEQGIEDTSAQIDAHISKTSGIHGATFAAMANTLMQRDENAQAQVGVPTAASHIARKQDVDAIRSDGTKPLVLEVRMSAPTNPPMGAMWIRADFLS